MATTEKGGLLAPSASSDKTEIPMAATTEKDNAATTAEETVTVTAMEEKLTENTGVSACV